MFSKFAQSSIKAMF
ncbi:TPA: hypothetical protein RPA04_003616 [Escherichia coli]|nr:hypothetical protein [Escherichia coli]HDY1256458.1 hypothetical protein [Escherichia coli]HEA7509077.1 hypothetical protein [Escherichia coli]